MKHNFQQDNVQITLRTQVGLTKAHLLHWNYIHYLCNNITHIFYSGIKKTENISYIHDNNNDLWGNKLFSQRNEMHFYT